MFVIPKEERMSWFSEVSTSRVFFVSKTMAQEPFYSAEEFAGSGSKEYWPKMKSFF